MRTNLVAGTALAGSLLMSTFVWQSAQATNAPNLRAAVGNSGTITLVEHDGGGGGGGGGRGEGGGGGGGDGGHMAARGGDGGGGGDHISGDGGGGYVKGGRISGGDNSGGNYSRRHFNGGKFVRDDDDRHFSNRDHDHDHFNQHRVFRNGAWFWAYGPYAGGDCGWLLHRAEVTGSPYWWRRYDLCVGYY
jgi:hypothetical protein